MSSSCKILGSNISVYNLQEVVQTMRSFIEEKKRVYICVSNVHTTVMGWRDPQYRDVTNKAALATADGVPLIWASRLLPGLPSIHGRAAGPDIMPLFLTQDTERKFHHFLYGSTPEVINRLQENIHSYWPGTHIVGALCPPFRPLTGEEEQRCVDAINQSNADIVWVGMGAPKQEQWMAQMREKLQVPILIGVGAAFDFLAHNKPRAPRWMQKSGLEWAFRLATEPRRLLKRYAVTNSLFIWGVAGQFLREFIGRKR